MMFSSLSLSLPSPLSKHSKILKKKKKKKKKATTKEVTDEETEAQRGECTCPKLHSLVSLLTPLTLEPSLLRVPPQSFPKSVSEKKELKSWGSGETFHEIFNEIGGGT